MVTRDTWKRQLQEHPDRPQGRQHRQHDALVALADQLDEDTGAGTASLLELVKAAGVSERTARRAIDWATTSGLLRRTARGHRLGDGTAASSGWLLLGQPAQPVNSMPEPANPAPQPVSSRSQPASSPKTPGIAAKRPGRKATKAEIKAAIAEFLDWAKKQPPCEHGWAGGDQIRPDDIAVCPNCRHSPANPPARGGRT